MCRHGAPRELLSDNGKIFRSNLMREICKLTNTNKTFTTVYHPETNGLVERFNGTLTTMLSMYVSDINVTGTRSYHTFCLRIGPPSMSLQRNRHSTLCTYEMPFYLLRLHFARRLSPMLEQMIIRKKPKSAYKRPIH